MVIDYYKVKDKKQTNKKKAARELKKKNFKSYAIKMFIGLLHGGICKYPWQHPAFVLLCVLRPACGGRLRCSTVDSRLEYMTEKTTIIALIICAVKRRQRDSLQQRVQAEHQLFTPHYQLAASTFSFLFHTTCIYFMLIFIVKSEKKIDAHRCCDTLWQKEFYFYGLQNCTSKLINIYFYC